MSDRTLLPGGGPRLASRRGRRIAAPAPTAVAPIWRPGDTVRWREYVGTYMRETVDGEVELLIGMRTYRVNRGELRPA
jgi:hypothetical protein